MPIDSGPNAPKWGPARTITVAGGSFAQLLRAGQWHPSAYCPHVCPHVCQDVADYREGGILDPRRWGREKPSLMIGMISNPFSA